MHLGFPEDKLHPSPWVMILSTTQESHVSTKKAKTIGWSAQTAFFCFDGTSCWDQPDVKGIKNYLTGAGKYGNMLKLKKTLLFILKIGLLVPNLTTKSKSMKRPYPIHHPTQYKYFIIYFTYCSSLACKLVISESIRGKK